MRITFLVSAIPIQEPYAIAECINWIEENGFEFKTAIQGIVKTTGRANLQLMAGRQTLQPVTFIFAETNEITFQIFFGEEYTPEMAKKIPDMIRERVSKNG
jgi:hypothetical protein